MASILEWLPPAVVSVTFLTLAGLKIYGLSQGVVGGGEKSARCRLLGRCPSWSNRGNVAMVGLFLVIGVLNLIWAAWALSGG